MKNDILFNLLPNFTPKENWGDYTLIDPELLVLMQGIRTFIGEEVNGYIHINNAYDLTGHSKKSQHFLGKACDFYVGNVDFKVAIDLILEFIVNNHVSDKVGFGIYLDWKTRGFHLDTRGTRARWSRVEGKYYGIDYGIEALKNENK